MTSSCTFFLMPLISCVSSLYLCVCEDATYDSEVISVFDFFVSLAISICDSNNCAFICSLSCIVIFNCSFISSLSCLEYFNWVLISSLSVMD